jgi:hypothetical protein
MGDKMRKIVSIRRMLSAAAVMLAAVFLSAMMPAVAQASTSFAPDCRTNQMTGQTDCGGEGIFGDMFGAVVVLIVIALIAAWRRSR